MICLADTDITLKLAACDLLTHTLNILGVKPKEVYVFKEEALRVYQYDPEVLINYSEEVRKRAIAFVNSSSGLYSEIHSVDQQAMFEARIDSGEQAIFGATRESTDFRVITADRKALRKLASAPSCVTIFSRMQGKTLSFDQILLMLIQEYAFEEIQTKIEPHIRYDRALEEGFAPGVSAEQAESRLKARIEQLQNETNQLLALTPRIGPAEKS